MLVNSLDSLASSLDSLASNSVMWASNWATLESSSGLSVSNSGWWASKWDSSASSWDSTVSCSATLEGTRATWVSSWGKLRPLATLGTDSCWALGFLGFLAAASTLNRRVKGPRRLMLLMARSTHLRVSYHCPALWKELGACYK